MITTHHLSHILGSRQHSRIFPNPKPGYNITRPPRIIRPCISSQETPWHETKQNATKNQEKIHLKIRTKRKHTSNIFIQRRKQEWTFYDHIFLTFISKIFTRLSHQIKNMKYHHHPQEQSKNEHPHTSSTLTLVTHDEQNPNLRETQTHKKDSQIPSKSNTDYNNGD